MALFKLETLRVQNDLSPRQRIETKSLHTAIADYLSGSNNSSSTQNAVKKVAQMVKEEKVLPKDIDSSLFESFLSTHPIPDPDLLIRTSGERRISNFLLYQSAYTELHYNDVLWPDFTEVDFLNAIVDYQGRDRRFGMTQEQIAKA